MLSKSVQRFSSFDITKILFFDRFEIRKIYGVSKRGTKSFPTPPQKKKLTERLFAATEGIYKSWACVTHELQPETRLGLRETCLFFVTFF
jgi:hypothetical protein